MCLPPPATEMFSFSKVILFSFLNFFTIASLSSSVPSTGVYFVKPSLIAWIAKIF